MASPVIELRSVSVRFGQNAILHDIDLSIDRGETFVIIGPSGEGKSVLLKIIAGILRPTSGEVLIDGRDLFAIPEKERVALQRRMGMLFQKNALFDSLTCGENIAFPLRETTALSDGEIDERVSRFLEAVGIATARELFPNEISGGMQKRLGIARALALQPEIVLYDDPTAGLDPITSRKIVDLILQLREQRGSTVVAITNDMNRAYQMASRIGMVNKGRLMVTGTPGETLNCPEPHVYQFVRGLLDGPLTERHD